ncbi:MAG: YdiU family protein, partial [Okeania sp. SIO2D1]|nr:YdiU family protein [Okeania sp. SIO2D1]
DFPLATWERWQKLYHQALNSIHVDEMGQIGDRLKAHNPHTALLRPLIERVWQPIVEEDNWQPFYDLLKTIWAKD